MKASELNMQDFLASNKTQFIIPVYQRNYDWTLGQCTQLFNDILTVGVNKQVSSHFIGSIVYIHDDVYTSSKVKELTIIDGQQRLTTITLVYIALLKLAIELGEKELESEIRETYLTNKFAQDNEKIKLRPTENNDKALQFLLNSDKDDEYKGYSRIIENYLFFKNKINKENYNFIMEGLSKLIFVEISLDREKDEPQRIFESLNSTGLELSQADLIRNYILMGLKREEQNKIYNEYWEKIELFAKDETTKASKVSDFIRDYLTLVNKKIPNKNKVYQEFKVKYPFNSMTELEKELKSIKVMSRYYNKLINPVNENDNDIKMHLEYINRLEINVAFPFLMKVLQDYQENIINKLEVIEIMELVQSYVWRRFIVGLPTNALNKIFMTLYDKVNIDNYVDSIKSSLIKRTGSQRYPKNSEVQEALGNKDIYNIKQKNRTYFLERLENHKNNETVTIEGNAKITVEHIFPQNPDIKWKKELGEEYSIIKEKYLNSIGNITLSGNNGKLSNKSFKEKRDLKDGGYKDSRLWLNKHLSNLDKWGIEEIEKRTEIITKRFFEIWDYPDILLDDEEGNGELNIFETDEPKNKRLEYVIFFDQKLEIKRVTDLYVEVIKRFFELQPETFFATKLGESIGLTKNPVEKRLRKPARINENYYVETNIDSNGKFEKIKQLLTQFDYEQELLIKYDLNFENTEGTITYPKNLLDIVAEALETVPNNSILRRNEIIKIVKDYSEDKYNIKINTGSIIPSDYCYNRINNGIDFKKSLKIFEFLGKGEYKYLGMNYPYTGKIYSKQIGDSIETEVGFWKDGLVKIY